ncbi:MAG: hypothetical protein ACRDFS_11275 [Chloroflexota bacterium]
MTQLVLEARAVELVATEADVPPENLPVYWDVSADLISLMADIEEVSVRSPDLPADDPEVLALRRRLRQIVSRLAELSQPPT